MNKEQQQNLESKDYNDNSRQIRWRCRRGMLELDYLLLNFFDDSFDDLSGDQKRLFASLLNHTDVQLYQWLTQKEIPDSAEMQALIFHILITFNND